MPTNDLVLSPTSNEESKSRNSLNTSKLFLFYLSCLIISWVFLEPLFIINFHKKLNYFHSNYHSWYRFYIVHLIIKMIYCNLNYFLYYSSFPHSIQWKFWFTSVDIAVFVVFYYLLFSQIHLSLTCVQHKYVFIRNWIKPLGFYWLTADLTFKMNIFKACFTSGSDYMYLTEQILYDIIEECEANDSYSKLIKTLGKVFCNIECLACSFLQTETPDIEEKSIDKDTGKFICGVTLCVNYVFVYCIIWSFFSANFFQYSNKIDIFDSNYFMFEISWLPFISSKCLKWLFILIFNNSIWFQHLSIFSNTL